MIRSIIVQSESEYFHKEAEVVSNEKITAIFQSF